MNESIDMEDVQVLEMMIKGGIGIESLMDSSLFHLSWPECRWYDMWKGGNRDTMAGQRLMRFSANWIAWFFCAATHRMSPTLSENHIKQENSCSPFWASWFLKFHVTPWGPSSDYISFKHIHKLCKIHAGMYPIYSLNCCDPPWLLVNFRLEWHACSFEPGCDRGLADKTIQQVPGEHCEQETRNNRTNI